ncbi:stability/partitioning determinant [Pectobacterium carotovorum]|uniref:stability/partitioning determinant n=1 Tax=Pectobacterium versatile TaxID=2488639 RepID=UPI000C7ECA9D|nr:stability/partitioning determinant [Pectobacterium versatile]PLY35383.1 stability/partitioning determinant [Pectobacterium carotovorum]
MSFKLKKPNILAGASSPETAPSGHAAAQFIKAGDRRPDAGRAIPCQFRLTQGFIDILEAESLRTGQNKTTILKAAIAAYAGLDDNSKNMCVLESAKI